MDSSTDKLYKALVNLFPDQFEVHHVIPVHKIACASLLHRHFDEPLLADKKQQLVMEIAIYLSSLDEHLVYNYFYRSNLTQPEWNMATAMLNKNKEGLPNEVVIFTYNLALLGDARKSFYKVIEDDFFFKTHFNKVALLTKKEKEVVSLIAQGNTCDEIAGKLFISKHTVFTHRKNISNKLAIKNIAYILRIADVFEFNT